MLIFTLKKISFNMHFFFFFFLASKVMQCGLKIQCEFEFLKFFCLGNEMVKGKIFSRAAAETDGSAQSPVSPCGDLLCSLSLSH